MHIHPTKKAKEGGVSLVEGKSKTLTLGFTALITTVLLIVFSEQGYHATVGGLQLFFQVVFPSLLPFFILSEVLLALGMVHFLGVFFEPLMRPLFNVPGIGSFVLSMGLAAGYPMDAVLTKKFRVANLCTRVEAERLLAFTNTADPLFIFGAVAVGMFHSPALGVVLAAAHYLGSLLVGLTFRFYGRNQELDDTTVIPEDEKSGVWSRAFTAMYTARAEDARPLGQIFNDAIADAVKTLFMIMSFIVLFAVLLRVLTVMGILTIIAIPLGLALHLIGISPQLATATLHGFFEIDLGTAAAAKTHAPLAQQLAISSAIIAWSGLSVHGQVASVLSGTDIRMKPYFIARLLHAVFAGVFTVLLLGPAAPVISDLAVPVFHQIGVSSAPIPSSFLADLWLAIVLGGGLAGTFLAAGILWSTLKSLRIIRFNLRP